MKKTQTKLTEPTLALKISVGFLLATGIASLLLAAIGTVLVWIRA